MKGICFIEPMFYSVIDGTKTQTRRIAKPDKKGKITNRYKKGEIIYLKEPYMTEEPYYRFNIDKIVADRRRWKNKLFMPESVARYFIEVTDVRLERLQDISEEDCIKEGIMAVKRSGHLNVAFDISQEWNYAYGSCATSLRESYARLIDKINGVGTWDENPLVFVYDFHLCEK